MDRIYADDGRALTVSFDVQEAARLGAQRIASMVTTLGQPLELGAPMAALFFTHGSPFFRSHELQAIQLSNTMAKLTGDGTVSVVYAIGAANSSITGERRVTANDPDMDYRFRPDAMASLSYQEFCLRCEKQKWIRTQPGPRAANATSTVTARGKKRYAFQPDHARSARYPCDGVS